MATTISRQARPWPASGETGFKDGSPMSTRIAYDMHYFLNNLCTYVDQQIIYAQSVTPAFAPVNSSGEPIAGYVEQRLPTSSEEFYLCQFPFIAKRGATRLVWTAGVEGICDNGVDPATVTAMTLYISSVPYLGASGIVGAVPFDSTVLPGATTTSRTVSLSISTTGRSFQRADDTSTGFFPLPAAMLQQGSQRDQVCYAIWTVTGYATYGSGAHSHAAIYDMTMWPLFV